MSEFFDVEPPEPIEEITSEQLEEEIDHLKAKLENAQKNFKKLSDTEDYLTYLNEF